MKKLVLLIAGILALTLIGQPVTLNSKKNMPALSSPLPTPTITIPTNTPTPTEIPTPTATPTPTLTQKPVINRPSIGPIRIQQGDD